MSTIPHYVEAFQAIAQASSSLPSWSWLGPRKKQALERFAALGFPTTSDEEWRFTSVAPIAQTRFPLAESMATRPQGVAAWRLEGAAELVLVDGQADAAPAARPALPSGVVLRGLKDALQDPEVAPLIERHLARVAGSEPHAFTALNTALFRDGAVLHVPAGTALKDPVHILHAASGRVAALMPRLLVLLGEDAEATFVETYLGPDASAYFTDAVTEVVLAPSARLEHVKLGLEGDAAFHVATIAVKAERQSVYKSRNFAIGGSLVRNDIGVSQAGEGTDVTLDGLFVARARQHVDNHTAVDHALPHGSSRQLYKGILDGAARGVFNGKVIVRAKAQKTDARQSNRNLLLSKDALIDTKPELQILADDVKCSHGATIGQIDPDQVYYLRSRGLGEAEARTLLVYAFAGEVIDRLPVPALQKQLHDLLLHRLPHGASLSEVV